MKNNEIKELNATTWVRKTTILGSFFLGWLITICGFFAPPLGIIDNSILILFGENLTFVGAAIGLKSFADIQTAKIEELFKDKNENET